MKCRYAFVVDDGEDTKELSLSIVPVQPFKVCRHDAEVLASMLIAVADKLVEMSSEEFKEILNDPTADIQLDES